MKENTYDYIIVGAGSAGCVLAARLTEEKECNVLLLEAGRRDNSWKIHMPSALAFNLRDKKYNWAYHTEPQEHMLNRVMYWPRGKVLGGSSSLNAMVYIRGHALDYQRWEKEGAKGFSYKEVLPYFIKAESYQGEASAYRGVEGLLKVQQGKCQSPLYQAFIESAVQAGFAKTKDMNGYQQEGFGALDMTITKGRRCSTAKAYLHPALKRKNLFLQTKVLATKVILDNKRAIGVEYLKNKKIEKVFCRREVILCGGAINSPQLLMLSGIGHADELKKIGIASATHLPGVGQNLQDHLEVYVQQGCKKPITLYNQQKEPYKTLLGLQWFLTKKGLGASSHLEAGGFVRSTPEALHPDIQFHFLPSLVIDHGRKPINEHAYQVHVGPMRPTSKGCIQLKNANPLVYPIIQPNYLSTEQDIIEMRRSVRISREIFAQNALAPFRGKERLPGDEIKTDRDIDHFIKTYADSAYHPSCTCKMGQDSLSVVNERMQVYGVDHLRVVDASIMPSIISGNLNAATIMLAEKAADIILGKPPLQVKELPVYPSCIKKPAWQSVTLSS